MPSLGQLTTSSSQFVNKRGIYLGRRSTKFHVALYRRSGGRIGGHIPGWPEARIALVDHTGAKSGVKRTSPVMYLEDGNAIVVMASKAGQPTHPAWFHNLEANPDTAVQRNRGGAGKGGASAHDGLEREPHLAQWKSEIRDLLDSAAPRCPRTSRRQR